MNTGSVSDELAGNADRQIEYATLEDAAIGGSQSPGIRPNETPINEEREDSPCGYIMIELLPCSVSDRGDK